MSYEKRLKIPKTVPRDLKRIGPSVSPIADEKILQFALDKPAQVIKDFHRTIKNLVINGESGAEIFERESKEGGLFPNEHVDESSLKRFFEEYLLKKLPTERREKAIAYLMTAFHQGGIAGLGRAVFFAEEVDRLIANSDLDSQKNPPLLNELFRREVIKINSTEKGFTANSQLDSLFIVDNDDVLKGEHVEIDKFNEKSVAGMRLVEADKPGSAAFALEIEVEMDFSNPEQVKGQVVKNEAYFGNEEHRKIFQTSQEKAIHPQVQKLRIQLNKLQKYKDASNAFKHIDSKVRSEAEKSKIRANLEEAQKEIGFFSMLDLNLDENQVDKEIQKIEKQLAVLESSLGVGARVQVPLEFPRLLELQVELENLRNYKEVSDAAAGGDKSVFRKWQDIRKRTGIMTPILLNKEIEKIEKEIATLGQSQTKAKSEQKLTDKAGVVSPVAPTTRLETPKVSTSSEISEEAPKVSTESKAQTSPLKVSVKTTIQEIANLEQPSKVEAKSEIPVETSKASTQSKAQTLSLNASVEIVKEITNLPQSQVAKDKKESTVSPVELISSQAGTSQNDLRLKELQAKIEDLRKYKKAADALQISIDSTPEESKLAFENWNKVRKETGVTTPAPLIDKEIQEIEKEIASLAQLRFKELSVDLKSLYELELKLSQEIDPTKEVFGAMAKMVPNNDDEDKAYIENLKILRETLASQASTLSELQKVKAARKAVEQEQLKLLSKIEALQEVIETPKAESKVKIKQETKEKTPAVSPELEKKAEAPAPSPSAFGKLWQSIVKAVTPARKSSVEESVEKAEMKGSDPRSIEESQRGRGLNDKGMNKLLKARPTEQTLQDASRHLDEDGLKVVARKPETQAPEVVNPVVSSSFEP